MTCRDSPVRVTARLRLVPIGTGHVDDLVRLHADPEVAAWHNGTWTRDRAIEFAQSCQARLDRDGISKWIAYDRLTGDLVGRGGLSRTTVDGALRWEIGWTVHRPCWGNGYATEIGREALFVAFGELGADEVVAFTEPENVRSQAVMRRLEMELAGDIDLGGERFVLYRSVPAR